MTKKEKKNLACMIVERMDKEYGTEMECPLNHEDAWELLVATILAAQCTDKRVNMVTKELFKKYPNVLAFAEADISELEQDIKSTGFYHNKAKNITETANILVKEYGGEVPDRMEELLKLPGVGRKTANVIRGNIYNEPSVVVDTHVKRITKKFGLTESDDPEKIEYDIMDILPEEKWIMYNIHVIRLGRSICTARNPKCENCFLQDICPGCRKVN